MNNKIAKELIKQFEQHQQEQLRCLQALFSNTTEDEAKDGGITTVNLGKADDSSEADEGGQINTEKTANPIVAPTLKWSTLNARSEGEIVHIPDDWSLPWNNPLLRQRIEERQKEPGCGGGLRRELSDIKASDPAASFIAINALKDLAHFTFLRDNQSSKASSELGDLAFYVIDSD
ncbi:MAG: hypothetical protein L6R41_006008 [Letrouitia leprolyta]|nr:MAG: hypothetical protein L6R41_006008 [Letrouitia leprolyta]